MVETILAALVAISTRGVCYEASQYPLPTDGEPTTGYVVIDDCVLYTTPELPAESLCIMAKTLSNPTGEGTDPVCYKSE